MSSERIPLDTIRVASPCEQNWEAMPGNERVRFCNECQLHVHNLSGITRDDAQSLIDGSSGRLCARFTPTEDGRVRTLDYEPLRTPSVFRTTRFWILASTVVALILGIFRIGTAARSRPTMMMGVIGPAPQTSTAGGLPLPVK